RLDPLNPQRATVLLVLSVVALLILCSSLIFVINSWVVVGGIGATLVAVLFLKGIPWAVKHTLDPLWWPEIPLVKVLGESRSSAEAIREANFHRIGVLKATDEREEDDARALATAERHVREVNPSDREAVQRAQSKLEELRREVESRA